MRGAIQARGWTPARQGGAVVLVTHVGDTVGSRAAAAALACAAAEPERAALLIELGDGRPPRSSLIATAGARELEERLAAHMPETPVASRGRICHLKLPADIAGIERIPAALPLARASAAVVLLPPSLLQPLLEEPRIRPTGVLLRADLGEDRALTALAARDLTGRGLRVAVLKQSLGWLPARWALLGVLPGAGVLPVRLGQRLLDCEDSKFQQCYDERDEEEGGGQATQRQEGQGSAPARWWEERRPTRQGWGRG